MKVKVGNTGDEVEIGHIKNCDKGCLTAIFSVVIYPRGEKISKCRYFRKEDSHWWATPQEEVKKQDGGKTDYYPYVKWLNKEYDEALKEAVLECLKDAIPRGTSEQAKAYPQSQSSPYTIPAPRIQAEPSFDFGAPPF